MQVIASKIQNKKLSVLHWDFIEETCRSFNAICKDKDKIVLPMPNKTIIALSHLAELTIEDIDLTNINIILVGCDDSGNDDWMEGYSQVKIATPNPYFLWSGVALGVVLYQCSLVRSM